MGSPNGGARKGPRLCENCRDPLGDSDYVIVTGRKTRRVWFLHRPSDPRRGMCFNFFTAGRDVVSVEASPVLAAFDPERDTLTWNIELARSVGLDERGCQMVGLDWAAVKRPRRRAK